MSVPSRVKANDAPKERLRLVVLTAGELTPHDAVLYERLAADPMIDLRAIVVDAYQRTRKPLVTRVLEELKRNRLRWLPYKGGVA